MPNWVKNRVRAVNRDDTEKLIAMLVRKNNEGECYTNFNGIIPMPDELMNTEDSTTEESIKKQKENKKKYGYSSWYDFACENWGTKWDRMKVDIEEHLISFNTAWSMPLGVYQEISKTIPIIVAYADEEIGQNCNIVRFDNGECYDIDIKGKSYQIANAIWRFCSEYIDEGLPEDYYDEEVNDMVDEILDSYVFVDDKK